MFDTMFDAMFKIQKNA